MPHIRVRTQSEEEIVRSLRNRCRRMIIEFSKKQRAWLLSATAEVSATNFSRIIHLTFTSNCPLCDEKERLIVEFIEQLRSEKIGKKITRSRHVPTASDGNAMLWLVHPL